MSVGELTFIGDRGFRDNQLCGCGKPFRDCDFWSEVIAQAAGPSPEQWFGRLAYLKQSVAQTKRFPALVLDTRRRTNAPLISKSAEYTAMLNGIIQAISRVADVNVIIDSSKEPVYGFHLGRCEDIDLYPAHLVRDSRAVAFSLQRVRVRPEIHWTTELMPRVSCARSALDWTLINSLMHLLGNTTGRYSRIRYEDIVEDPQGASMALLGWAGVNIDANSDGKTVHDGNGEHELSGNPMRFQREFKIVPDREWLDSLSNYDYAITTALSAPLLARYGYQLGRPSQATIGVKSA